MPDSLSCRSADSNVDVFTLSGLYIGESVLYHMRLGFVNGLDRVDPSPVSFGIVVYFHVGVEVVIFSGLCLFRSLLRACPSNPGAVRFSISASMRCSFVGLWSCKVIARLLFRAIECF